MLDLLYVIIIGLFVGIITSVPIGAVSLYTIKNTMNHSLLLGIVTGLAASLGDFIYATISVFSINYVEDILNSYQYLIRIVGGSLILFLSYRIFTTLPIPFQKKIELKDSANYFKCGITAFFLTITNPMTFFGFVFIFATFSMSSHLLTSISRYVLVISIYFGSVLWWMILSLTIKFIKHKITQEFLIHINKICGSILFILGIGAIISGII